MRLLDYIQSKLSSVANPVITREQFRIADGAVACRWDESPGNDRITHSDFNVLPNGVLSLPPVPTPGYGIRQVGAVVDTNAILTEVDTLLTSVRAIANYSNTGSYSTSSLQAEIQSINSQVSELEARTRNYNAQVADSRTKAIAQEQLLRNFNPVEIVTNGLTPSQKSHMLIKSWAMPAANAVKAKILQDGDFDLYYKHPDGTNLINLAVIQGDRALFETLANHHFDFSKNQGGQSVFKDVLDSDNKIFIRIMLDNTPIELKTSMVQGLVMQDDATSLRKVFEVKPDLASMEVSGYSLLQLALTAKRFAVVDEVLRANPDCLTKVSHGMSAAMVALRSGDKEIITFLQKNHNVNFEAEASLLIKHDAKTLLGAAINLVPALCVGQSGINLAKEALGLDRTEMLHMLNAQEVNIDTVLQDSFRANPELLTNIVHYYNGAPDQKWINQVIQSGDIRLRDNEGHISENFLDLLRSVDNHLEGVAAALIASNVLSEMELYPESGYT
jgi:hypothetical protein